MSDNLTESAAHRVFGIDVRRIDVSGHYREKGDVLLGERALERGAVAHIDFIKQTGSR